MKSTLIMSAAVLFAATITSCEKFGKKDECEKSGYVTYTADETRTSDFSLDGVTMDEVEKMEIYFIWGAEGSWDKDDKEDWDKEDKGDWDKDEKDWGSKGDCDKGDWKKEKECYSKAGSKETSYKFVAYSTSSKTDVEASQKDDYNAWYEVGSYVVDEQLNITFYPENSDVTSRTGSFDTDKSILTLSSTDGHTSDLTFSIKK